ncbi:unnamed protein product (macronuclear) [Paramecium tetraurelia]|uniref:Uncharacterized protein n=1 Tax=Paramecium tetraurelia TaxID=5888 RepID=A0DHZ3_PARTE|nr:uncharacterized protein GSPATT00017031001 [Paramecium tetraurelia]CAK82660.1 unnamed protein product [Paramecium tetraurelia]|eukprot:XP_001450057.1 hypothetical protein (macronuclear) [Paramecium tetraurelia strain d4-2]
MKQQYYAPKPDFCLLEQQPQSLPDDGISHDSRKSLDFVFDATLKIRYDRFGNLIDKKKRQQQVSFRDRIEKTQKLYDLIVFDYFKIEQIDKQKKQLRQNQQLCCKIQ